MWRDGHSLLAGGDWRHGLTAEGEAFAAGVLAALPALTAIGAPSVASYLRLVPSRWAGAYHCWGLENREAAPRLVTGSTGEQDVRANIEIKCFDLAANPYLVAGSLIAAGLAGLDADAALPEEITVDPAGLADAELARRGIRRLPRSLAEAAGCLEASAVLREAMDGRCCGRSSPSAAPKPSCSPARARTTSPPRPAGGGDPCRAEVTVAERRRGALAVLVTRCGAE